MRNFLLFFAAFMLSLHSPYAQTTSSFDDLGLPIDSFWNGSDASGGFISGNAFFGNVYNPQWSSWSGWSYSSKSDTINYGYTNQYSSIVASGYNSGTYAIAFVSSFEGPTYLSLRQMARGKTVLGFYISNSTYAYLSMLNGDSYSKKFGGLTGSDPDWFRLKITGFNNGFLIDSTDYYLADFRDSVGVNDYILKSWDWVDLSALGSVDSLVFELSSSDNGLYGMNTPAYFCIDNFITSDGVGMSEVENIEIQMFPNPAQEYLNLISDNIFKPISIVDYSGKIVLSINGDSQTTNKIDVSSLQVGIYFLKFEANGQIFYRKFQKK